MEWREEGKKGGVCGRETVCNPREKNHILNQIKAMFVQVTAVSFH